MSVSSVYMYNSHNLALMVTVSPVQLEIIKFNSAGFFFVQVFLKQPQLCEKHCGLESIELIAIFTLSIFRAGQCLVKVMRILTNRRSTREGKGEIFCYSTSAFVQHSCQGSSSYGVQVIFCTSCFFNDDSKCTVKQSWGEKKILKNPFHCLRPKAQNSGLVQHLDYAFEAYIFCLFEGNPLQNPIFGASFPHPSLQLFLLSRAVIWL